MKVRTSVRIALLFAAVAAVTLSCGIDYSMDFSIDDVITGADYVQVYYTMHNSGAYDMENAAIHILVSANSGTALLALWTPDGVELPVYGTVSDTMIFSFGYAVSGATAVVTGARWDRASDLE